MVQSADGKGVAAMSTEAGNGEWKRYEHPAGQTTTPLAGPDVLTFVMKGETITEIAAFSATTGEWATQRLLKPVKEQISPVVGPGCALFQEGNNFYAFSAQKGQWDVLSLPDGEKPRASSLHQLHHGAAGRPDLRLPLQAGQMVPGNQYKAIQVAAKTRDGAQPVMP